MRGRRASETVRENIHARTHKRLAQHTTNTWTQRASDVDSTFTNHDTQPHPHGPPPSPPPVLGGLMAKIGAYVNTSSQSLCTRDAHLQQAALVTHHLLALLARLCSDRLPLEVGKLHRPSLVTFPL